MTASISARGRFLSAFMMTGAIVAAGAASPSLAQDPVEGSSEEVVVTAQKRSQSLQEVPSTISAFGARDLKARGIRTIGDLAAQLPAVNFGEVAGTAQISARGVGFGLLTGAGENSVAFHIDGLYLSRPGAAGMMQDDLQRIEFLRGPQGTLYGRNATGGVINLITPTPVGETEYGFRIAAGDFGLKEASGYIGGALSDRIRARLYVGGSQRDGYVKNTFTGERIDDLESYGARLSVDADISENSSLQVRLFHRRQNFKGPVYKPIDSDIALPPGSFELDPFEIAADAPYDADRTISGGSVRLESDLGAVRFVSLTGYIDYEFIEHSYDGDGTALPMFTIYRPENSKTFSQEINLIGGGAALEWVAGAYYLKENVDLDFFTSTPAYAGAPLFISRLVDLTHEESESYSVFADATYAFDDRWSVFGGIRGLWEDRRFEHADLIDFSFGLTVPVCTPADTQGRLAIDTAAAAGRLGVRYKNTTGSSVYAQYSRGYKSGGFGISSCGDVFAPENLDAFEIGAKNRWDNGRVTLNGAVFYYDYKNLQVEQVEVTDLKVNNAPKAHIFGIEAELLWRISDTLTLNAGASAMEAKYDVFADVDPLNPGLGLQDLRGKRLTRAPDWTLNLGLQYEVAALSGTLIFRGDLYATGDYALRPYNEARDFQDGYVTLGGSIAYRSPDERWTVRAWVKNVTDEAYLQGMLNSAGTGRLGVYAPPRTLGIELTADF